MCVNPKYSIRHRLRQLPGNITQNTYRLCIEIDRSEPTLTNWMNTPKEAKFSIPSDELIKLAKYFNCEITDLINGDEKK